MTALLYVYMANLQRFVFLELQRVCQTGSTNPSHRDPSTSATIGVWGGGETGPVGWTEASPCCSTGEVLPNFGGVSAPKLWADQITNSWFKMIQNDWWAEREQLDTTWPGALAYSWRKRDHPRGRQSTGRSGCRMQRFKKKHRFVQIVICHCFFLQPRSGIQNLGSPKNLWPPFISVGAFHAGSHGAASWNRHRGRGTQKNGCFHIAFLRDFYHQHRHIIYQLINNLWINFQCMGSIELTNGASQVPQLQIIDCVKQVDSPFFF